MRVYKFGGASVKDATAVRNVVDIIKHHSPDDSLLVVISAMGKTTNALEDLLNLSVNHKPYSNQVNELYQYHEDIVKKLFEDIHHEVYFHLAQRFQSLTRALQRAKKSPYNQAYDEVVAHGELISTVIVEAYLKVQGVSSKWIDARDYISTNNLHREAQVNWPLTSSKVNRQLSATLQESVIITQGFIGRSSEGHTTTLGREGSDFSAAIFASCLNAQSVTIWKDVPGVLNADPKRLPNTKLYSHLSYFDAAEMTYYGASVIHPKTIKPLANQQIPLLVRSFAHPTEPGTRIGNTENAEKTHQQVANNATPAIIFKQNQSLITFNIRDFSFITERNLSQLFFLLDMLHIKINVMQNSAISVSICIDGNESKNRPLVNSLESEYDIRYNEGLTLITIKNYTEEEIAAMTRDREVLLEQRTRNTYQIVVK